MMSFELIQNSKLKTQNYEHNLSNTVVMHFGSKVRKYFAPYTCIMKVFGEVTKSVWGMPWHWKAMKDVVTCDKPGLDGSCL